MALEIRSEKWTSKATFLLQILEENPLLISFHSPEAFALFFYI